MGDPLQGFDLGTRRRRERLRVPLTPLIDVIFLLVMFFLLSSTFSDLRVLRIGLTQTAPVRGEGAKAPDQAGRAPVFITVARAAGATEAAPTAIRVDGQAVDLDDLGAHLERLAEEGAVSAVVRARPGTNLQDIVSVLDVARGSGLAEVGILAGR